jgi:HPt (histidine-containing phosphotransfer) domain-containing protein
VPADVPGVTEVLDMSVVDELISLSDDGDPELLLDLIGLYLADAPSKLDAVMEGMRTGDLDKVERAAHSLKGSSGNLGARQLQHTCELLQLRSNAGDLAGTRKAAAQLAAMFEDVRGALLQLRDRFV